MKLRGYFILIYLKSARLKEAKDRFARNSLIAQRFRCGAQSPRALVRRRVHFFLRDFWFEPVGGSLTPKSRFIIAFLNSILSYIGKNQKLLLRLGNGNGVM